MNRSKSTSLRWRDGKYSHPTVPALISEIDRCHRSQRALLRPRTSDDFHALGF